MTASPQQRRTNDDDLVAAIEDATGYLTAGISMIAAPGWRAPAAQPALSNISIGVEKLAKVTIGQMLETDTGAFPGGKGLKRFGHRIDELTSVLGDMVETRASRLGKAYVLDLKHTLNADPYWPILIEALDIAADAERGRYVHEVRLGGGTPKGPSVQEVWARLDEMAVADLGVLADLSGSGSGEALVRVRHRAVMPVVQWWNLMVRTWQHGVAGPRARTFSSEVALAWSYLPDDLCEFARSL